jgi:histidinol-phosphate aminotransferase
VLDECYAPFAQPVSLPGHFVLSLRGLSKLHGLAALRLGYVVADGWAARRLRACQVLKSLPAPCLALALGALRDFDAPRALEAALARRSAVLAALPAAARASGAGPYVVLPAVPGLRAWLRARGVRAQALRGRLVYQPRADWDARFCSEVAMHFRSRSP